MPVPRDRAGIFARKQATLANQRAARELLPQLLRAMGSDYRLTDVAADTGIAAHILTKWSGHPDHLAERHHAAVKEWIARKAAA